jgi:ubiquinone biosynthesis protein
VSNGAALGRPLLALRGITVCAIIAAAGARLVTRLVWSSVTRQGRGPADLAAAAAAEALTRLGPAFIKAGQLLSTRVDLLPRSACRALARLYDQVPPVPAAAAADAVPAGLLAELDGGADGLAPAAAGSIACVYRARSRAGDVLAIKVRRPGVERTVARDLALLRACAALLQRVPWMRGAPLADVAAQIGESVRRQLDFTAEAAALRSLRDNLAEMAGVRVPAVRATPAPGVLVMDYIDGLRRGAVSGPAGRTATVSALHAVYHMLFLDGFVHCDLHPGNLYPMPDGSVVIVDGGFFRRLTNPARRAFAAFFYQMSRGDGAACADIVLSTVRPAGPPGDPAGLRDDVARLVERNSRVTVAEFDLVGFAVQLFALQRRHGYYADPQFVFPILSLIVLEGTLREVCPDVDFQLEGLPFALRGLMKR